MDTGIHFVKCEFGGHLIIYAIEQFKMTYLKFYHFIILTKVMQKATELYSFSESIKTNQWGTLLHWRVRSSPWTHTVVGFVDNKKATE